jgi:hypothetical protein
MTHWWASPGSWTQPDYEQAANQAEAHGNTTRAEALRRTAQRLESELRRGIERCRTDEEQYYAKQRLRGFLHPYGRN